jgi:Tol biopolymer transport system component
MMSGMARQVASLVLVGQAARRHAAFLTVLALAAPAAASAPGPARLIAFDRSLDGSGSIFVVRADGTGLRRVGRETGSAHPAWAPDGRRIAYDSGGDGLETSVHVAGLDGRLRRIRPGASGAQWSPDGRRLAFVATTPSGLPEVWVAEALTLRARRLAAAATLPRWSPDGRLVAVVEPASGSLALVPAGGGPPRRLGVTASQGPSGPAWSPDGRRLAVVSPAGRLEVVDAGSGGVRVLTRGTGARGASFPAWSPDGRLVAALIGPHAMLTVMRADGSARRGLGPADGQSAPAWSPDARFLAFADAAHHIELVGRTGSPRRRLTSGPATDADPAWAPAR